MSSLRAFFGPVEKMLGGVGFFSAASGISWLVVKTCLFSVDGGYRAVVFDRLQNGTLDKVRGEGLHFKIPFIQKPVFYEVRTRFTNIGTETGSKDLQTVGINLRLLYHPRPDKLPDLHRQLGPDYDDRVLPSLANEILKAVVAQYDVDELITQRELVSGRIRDDLTARASEFFIQLDDVSITHLEFSQEFTKAIESKQVAQQTAEKAKYTVAKFEQEKKAAIIKASGEAEAAMLINDAMKFGPGFIELRRIEAAREIADALANNRNVTYLPTGTSILLNLPASRPGPTSPHPPPQ